MCFEVAVTRPSLSLVAVIASLLLTQVASAQQHILVNLEWDTQAPQDCVLAEEVVTRVERHLNREVFVAPDHADVGLRVAFTEDIARLVLVSAGREAGTRTVQWSGRSCSERRQTLSLVVAMLVDLRREELDARLTGDRASLETASQPTVSEASAPQPVVTAATRRDSPPRRLAGERPKRTLRYGAQVDSGIDFGTLPAATLQASAAGAVFLPTWPALLVGLRILPLGSRTGTPGVLVRGGFARLATDIPMTNGTQRWSLTAVAGVEAGILHARAEGFVEDGASHEWMAGMVLGPRVRLRLGARLWLTAAAFGHGFFVRPRFLVVEDSAKREVFRARSVALSSTAGLEWRSF